MFHNSNDGRIRKKQTRFSVYHCLGAWDWWSGRGNTKFGGVNLTPDEKDTMPNSQVRQRTVMASGAPSVSNFGRLWLWAASPHGDRESRILRPCTSSTRHGYRDRCGTLSQCVSHCRSGCQADRALAGQTSWKSSPIDTSILLRVDSSIGRRCRLGQESGCTPLTNGKCHYCHAWDVDEACRI